ncbi:hypothetical protein BDV09DRAFT_192886 [Aspergillus tetrazonus]
MTTLILMSAYMHLAFGVIVWKYGGPRRKVVAQGVFATVFAFWYWQCWHSPAGVGWWILELQIGDVSGSPG